jgi:D-alanine-D-alanine ligase
MFQVIILYRSALFRDPSPETTIANEAVMHRFEATLQSAGFDAHLVSVGDDIADVLAAFDPAQTVVFNSCEGTEDNPYGYDPITALLERAGFVYTGAADEVLAWSFNKADMKTRLLQHNIPTPEYAIYIDGDSRGWSIFPALVKPVNQHSSVGITRASVVDTPEQLEARVRHVCETWGQPALVEDFIDGPEYRVYILGNRHLEILPVYATYYDNAPDYHDHIWGYDNKWTEHGTNDLLRYELPARLDADLQTRIVNVAVESYRRCGARDYGAVDLRLRDGIPYVLDANQNADISEGYSFAQAAAAAGYSYAELVTRIVLLAAERLPGGSSGRGRAADRQYGSQVVPNRLQRLQN